MLNTGCTDISLLDYVSRATNDYIAAMPKTARKQYGQFFTSPQTAEFMASLFDLSAAVGTVSILDPGAGSGLLSAAMIERLQAQPRITKIKLVCYESNPDILELLQANLEYICAHALKPVEYELRNQNYILSQASAYRHENALGLESYDYVIGNPPYKKLRKDAPEAAVAEDVCYGAPNLYFIFAAMSLFNLKVNGELVYIIPRSWTSGAYFRKFRQKFLSQGALEHIHLFVSRDKVFDQEAVLQETTIIKVRKTTERPASITFTTSQCNLDFAAKTEFAAPYDLVVCGQDNYVFFLTCEEDVHTMQRLRKMDNTLADTGMRMRTGLTVGFRNRDALHATKAPDSVPLFEAGHIRNGEVLFPFGEENFYLQTKQAGLLQKNANYLFVKRFTAKEEKRRLQCGIYLARKYPEYQEISTENKINFISGEHDLSECEVYGLYVLFNSTLYDNYYRILNGSTQVNASEINSMPVPAVDIIRKMGQMLMNIGDLSVQNCDQILGEFF